MLDYILIYSLTKSLKFMLRPFAIIPVIGFIISIIYNFDLEQSIILIIIFAAYGLLIQIFEIYFNKLRAKFLNRKLSVYFKNFPKEINKNDFWLYELTYFPDFVLLFILLYSGFYFYSFPSENLITLSVLTSLTCTFLMSCKDFIIIPSFNVNGTSIKPQEKFQDIHVAVKNNDLEKLERLLGTGANVNLLTNKKRAAIHLSIECHYVEVTELLIKYGADINLPGGNFIAKPPLFLAIEENDMIILELLLNAKADRQAVDGNGNNALWYAIYYAQHSLDIFDFLLKKGVDHNHINQSGHSLLTTAAGLNQRDSFAPHPFAVKYVNKLLSLGMNPDGNVDGSKIPMIEAAGALNFEVVNLLLKNRADPNKQDQYYYTALIVSICHHDYKLVKLLINNGADVNLSGSCVVMYKGEPLYSPLAMARKVKKTMLSEEDKREITQIINLLIDNGAK